jgi:FkbM family methyltransferase
VNTAVIPPELAWYFEEEQPVRNAHWHPGDGDVVIDVGCMMGNYTVPALEAGATVVAVDPNTALTNTLCEIATQNEWRDRLIVSNCAIFDGGDYTRVRTGVTASPYAHLLPPAGTTFMTLDQLTDSCQLNQLDWVKIDVEGAEYGVLRGAERSLQAWHPHILIEDHSLVYPFVKEMRSTELCMTYLELLGYRKIQQWPFDELRTFIVASAS